jgi:hypothetical protein
LADSAGGAKVAGDDALEVLGAWPLCCGNGCAPRDVKVQREMAAITVKSQKLVCIDWNYRISEGIPIFVNGQYNLMDLVIKQPEQILCRTALREAERFWSTQCFC